MRNWIAAKPFTAFVLSAVFGSIATAAALREDWLPYLLGLFSIAVLVMTVSMWKFTAPVVLAGIMALAGLPSTKAQGLFPERDSEIEPASVGVAAAIVVVCVGSYCIYKVVKFCQKKFPPKDDSSNSLSGFRAGGGRPADEYGAAYNYGAVGSCAEWEGDFRAASDEDHTLYRLNILIDSPYSFSQSMSARAGGDQQFQTFSQFQAEMAGHGLNVSGAPDGSQSFSINRQPVDPTMSPISFDPITKTARNIRVGEGEMRRILVTRSDNLRDWTPFVSTDVGVGAGIQVVDTTRSGQMFYRVEMSQP